MHPPLTFSCLIALNKTLSTILNRSRDYVHFCLFPHFGRKGLNFSSFSMWLSVGLWDIILIPSLSKIFLFYFFFFKKKLIIWVSYIIHPDCPHFPVLLCIPLIPAPTLLKPSPFFIHSLELGQTPSGQSPKGRLVFLPMYSTQPEAINCEEPCCNM